MLKKSYSYGHCLGIISRPTFTLKSFTMTMMTIMTMTSISSMTFGVAKAADAGSMFFRAQPYVIKNKKNENILKFSLKRTKTLNIESHVTSPQGEVLQPMTVTMEKSFDSYDAHEINLGVQPCDHTVSYTVKIADARSSRPFSLTNQLNPIPCTGDEDLVFGLLADTQQNVGHEDLAEVVMKHLPEKMNFIANGGDLVHFGAVEGPWLAHFRVATPYYNQLPVIAALGNHEYWFSYLRRGSSALFRKYMRAAGDPEDFQLSLSFPQVEFIVFNTNFSWLSKEEYKALYEWLENRLVQVRQEGRKAIVLMHHSPFTSGAAKGGGLGRSLREEFVPLMEKVGNVPLVLSGHEHIYERSLKNGVHYVVTGPAGGFKYRSVAENPYQQYVNDRARTFSMVKVNKQRIELKTYDQENTLIDQVTIPLSPVN